MKKLFVIFILLSIMFSGCDNPAAEIIPEPIEESIPEEEENSEEETVTEEPEETIPEPEPEPVEYGNVFRVSGYQRTETTPMILNWPLLIHDGTEYDLSTMTPNVNGLPVRTSYTETERIISVDVECDTYSFFYFMNDNMLTIEGIDQFNMSSPEFATMLTFIYKPIPPPPEYSSTMYNMMGYQRVVGDSIFVSDESITISGDAFTDDDLSCVIADDIRTVQIGFDADVSDFFLFMSGNCENFFGIEPSYMTRPELVILADILTRYPEEGILDLMEVYPK